MKLYSKAFIDHKIDLNFGKFASSEYTENGLPVTSFDVSWELDNLVESRYLHLIYIDFDAISACGKPFIHWAVANLDTDKYAFLPENASRDLANELTQGLNSMISPQELKDPSVWAQYTGFIGSMPPNSNHIYTLIGFTTHQKIEIPHPFTADVLFRELLSGKNMVEQDYIQGMYPVKL